MIGLGEPIRRPATTARVILRAAEGDIRSDEHHQRAVATTSRAHSKVASAKGMADGGARARRP